MIGRTTIAAAAALFALGMWAAPAQAVQIDLASPAEGGVVQPGDEVEATITVTNDTAEKDIVHITFDLTVEIAGEPVYTATAKRRMKLAADEAVIETILVVIPDVDLPVPALASMSCLPRRSTVNGSSVFAVIRPPSPWHPSSDRKPAWPNSRKWLCPPDS